jgi:hypothetical protein
MVLRMSNISKCKSQVIELAERFKHEDVSAVPAGWKVRTVTHGDHRVRVAFPPGRKVKGSGRLVSVLHPVHENPTCAIRSSNPAELLIMGANPPRKYAAETKLERQRAARERAAAIRAARLSNAGMKHGLHIKYSPINNAYFLMWHGSILRIFETKKEARAEMNYLLRDVKENARNNPAEFICPRCGEKFTAAQVESGEFLKHLSAHRGAGRNPNPSELLIMGANPENARGRTIPEILNECDKLRAALRQRHPNNPALQENAGSVYSKAVSMGYPYARGDGKTAPDDQTWLSRFTKQSDGSGPVLYVGWDHENRKWVIEHGRNPAEHESNPRVEVVHSENPPVETIVEEFTGQDAEWIDVYNEPHIPRGRYAQLGKLIALYIKPAKGGQVIRIGAPESARANFPEYWNGRPPVVVSDRTAKQIYFVDGCQDITEMLPAFGAIDRGNGLLELGAARRIDYQCRKEHVADPEEDLWKHTHGEENGELPTVCFDTRAKRLLYRGGDYRIEGAWIKN